MSQRPVVLELQRADGVRDALDRVGLPVCHVVGGVDAPGVACSRMLGVQDPVQDRVAHVDVPGGHIDLRSQHASAVRELTGSHATEQIEALLDRPIAPRAVRARLGQCAAMLADLIGSQIVDVGLSGSDQLDGPLVQLLEVVGGEVEVLAPVEPQPADVGLDGVDVLLLFLHRVGVVEAQVAPPAELVRYPEVQADRLGVADVEVAVRLGREAGDDGGDSAGAQIIGDDVADEVGVLW
jgi:hypothetical protein